jgi:hypothetical protein
MGLPATPSMPNHGDLLACRTNANHLAGLAFGVVPWDKYNHCGGEGSSGSPLQRCPVGRLRYLLDHKSIWKKSLTLTPPPLYLLRLAGKQVTRPQTWSRT